MASASVFLESLDAFTATFFVGVPEVTTLPLLLSTASMEGRGLHAGDRALPEGGRPGEGGQLD
jgi:hypothetical protein